jgi:hypothetical protein
MLLVGSQDKVPVCSRSRWEMMRLQGMMESLCTNCFAPPYEGRYRLDSMGTKQWGWEATPGVY